METLPPSLLDLQVDFMNYFSADFLSVQLVDFLTYLGAISGYILTSNVVRILFLLSEQIDKKFNLPSNFADNYSPPGTTKFRVSVSQVDLTFLF
jgi:hypothetical protein